MKYFDFFQEALAYYYIVRYLFVQERTHGGYLMLLEVGSVLYDISAYHYLNRLVIDRVTAKRAYVKVNDIGYEYIFNRHVPDNGYAIRIGGSDGYSRLIYRVETPELLERFTVMQMRIKFARIKASNLSKEQLEQILAIAFPKETGHVNE